MSKLLSIAVKCLWTFLPKLRALLAEDNARAMSDLQERLKAYEEHFKQQEFEIAAHKGAVGRLSDENLKLRVNASMVSAEIEQKNIQIARLLDEVRTKQNEIDRLTPDAVWNTPIATEDNRTVAAEG